MPAISTAISSLSDAPWKTGNNATCSPTPAMALIEASWTIWGLEQVMKGNKKFSDLDLWKDVRSICAMGNSMSTNLEGGINGADS